MFGSIVTMNTTIKSMIELQTLECNEVASPDAEKRIASLRATIPQPFLAHYDRLMSKGKKGVAALHNQVCTGCHMRVPLATYVDLVADTDVRLCDNCGRYLYLQEVPAATPAPAPAPKKAAKASRRQLVHAA
jgi:predicted  nucleic acid-binding Zn-ribbon protein